MTYKIIGQNKRCYPAQNPLLEFPSDVEITVVLVEGDIGDYAAYVGIGDPQWIAAHGNKISFKEAQVHFCDQLEKDKYRS